MKLLPLIWAALARHKLRTFLTLFSIVAAFALFGTLDSVRSAFAHQGEGIPGANRLQTISKFMSALPVPLPQSLYYRIQAVPGVINLSYASLLFGTYQDPKNFVAVQPLEPHYFDLLPEWSISPASLQAFRETRTGALAGETLAKRYNWKSGDKIPLQMELPQKSGSNIWTFDLVGTYRVNDSNLKPLEDRLYVSWAFVDEGRQSGNGTVGWFSFKIANLAEADGIARAVDSLSANSDHETKTQSEQEFATEYARRFADVGTIVGLIMGAVFFTLVLLTGNAMSQAVRERIPELATLKAIGFTARAVLGLVLCESILVLLLGSVIGLVLAAILVETVHSQLPVPMLPVSGTIWLRGLTLALLIGLAVGAPPAIRAMRLRIVDALSGH